MKDIKGGNVKEINLNSAYVEENGAKYLASAMKENKSTTWMDLGSNNIGDEGAKHLASAMKENKSITTIYLDDNDIGDEGAKYLVEAMKENMSTTTIYIAGNNIRFGTLNEIELLMERNKGFLERRRVLKALLSCLSSTSTNGAFNGDSFERNYLFDLNVLRVVIAFIGANK